MNRKTKAVVVQEDPPIEQPVLAQAIVDASNALKKLLASGLTRQAIVILVAKSARRRIHDVDVVLRSLASLADDYVTKPTKGPK